VQQSASSSTELSAAAEQMLKLSRNLLDNMDRFVIDRSGQLKQRKETLTPRRSSHSEARDLEYAGASRS